LKQRVVSTHFVDSDDNLSVPVIVRCGSEFLKSWMAKNQTTPRNFDDMLGSLKGKEIKKSFALYPVLCG